MKNLYIILITLFTFGSIAYAATPPLTTNQGGTGVSNVAAGSILFGSVANLRMATSSALQWSNTGANLSFTYGSSTALTATTICLATTCKTAWPTGTVTSVATNYSLTGGTITTSGTLAVATSSLYTGSAGGLLTFTGTNIIGSTAAGTAGFVLAMSGGIPTWVATSSINNGVSSLAQTFGSAQSGALTIATSSDTNLLLNITNNNGAFTFTPAWTGTLADSRITSASTWNAKQAPGFQISTTSSIGISKLAYFAGATPTSLAGVATTSETCTYPVICSAHDVLTGGGAITSGFGTTTTIGVGNNLSLYTNNAGVMIGIATSSSSFSIGGNAATVTTNANLSGVVTSSGNTTSFGSQAAGILGAVATGNTSVLATSTINGDTATFGVLKTGIASTTPNFTLSVGTGTAGFYIDSAGKVVGYDTTNNWMGRISPTHSFVLGTGTTTGWTASSSGAYSPYLVMPFAGTLRQVRCALDASFLGVNVVVNGSNATPSYFVASTTIGVEKFTAGNTFSAGQKILANFGTTTTASATTASCTFDVTES